MFTEKALLFAKLQAAEKAYFEIISGKGVRTLVDQNGERIEYQMANLPRLVAYIEDLKIQLGCSTKVTPPMKVWF